MGLTRRKFETDAVGLSLAHDSAALHVQGTAVYIEMRASRGLLHVYPGFQGGARGKIKSRSRRGA
jgi:xanthine dehydrogenase molybdopterin-binding subunit B